MPVRDRARPPGKVAERRGVALWPALAALSWSGCGAAPSPCGPASAVVDYVVDGDTVELQGGQRLRLLLVDTPETTQGKNDCYGQEAKAFTVEKLAGKTVQLAYDDQACVDRYGRTLAWVKVDGLDLNAELVRRGLACTLFIKPGGQARADEFATYEAEAKTGRTGMWGACSIIPCSM